MATVIIHQSSENDNHLKEIAMSDSYEATPVAAMPDTLVPVEAFYKASNWQMAMSIFRIVLFMKSCGYLKSSLTNNNIVKLTLQIDASVLCNVFALHSSNAFIITLKFFISLCNLTRISLTRFYTMGTELPLTVIATTKSLIQKTFILWFAKGYYMPWKWYSFEELFSELI